MTRPPSALAAHRPAILADLERRLRDGNPRELREAIDHQLASTGKMLRPCLMLWWHEVLGGRALDALPLASALELFHVASLIQDDIQDEDTLRRGRPSLWARFGIPRALAAADRLLAEAHIAISDLEAPTGRQVRLVREVAHVYLSTSIGQALDLERRPADQLGRRAYERAARRKSGGAFAIAWTGPAILHGEAEARVDPLRRAGEDLGLAFQILDDLKDLVGDKDGRAAGSDLAEGKLGAPVACAVEALPSCHPHRERLAELLRKPRASTSDEDRHRGIALVRDLEGDVQALAWATDLLQRTSRTLAARLADIPGAHRTLQVFLDSLATASRAHLRRAS